MESVARGRMEAGGVLFFPDWQFLFRREGGACCQRYAPSSGVSPHGCILRDVRFVDPVGGPSLRYRKESCQNLSRNLLSWKLLRFSPSIGGEAYGTTT